MVRLGFWEIDAAIYGRGTRRFALAQFPCPTPERRVCRLLMQVEFENATVSCVSPHSALIRCVDAFSNFLLRFELFLEENTRFSFFFHSSLHHLSGGAMSGKLHAHVEV
jgi:hypothetical protein